MTYKSLYDMMKAFPTEESCIMHLEHLRWPKGVICPHCGSSRKIYRVSRSNSYKCSDCRKEFSVRKGTIFEESRLPLRKWFAATWLVTSNRKGISSCQLAREIGVTQKTAWFMLHRIRLAMQDETTGGKLSDEVEVDETFIGGKARNMHTDVKARKIQGRCGPEGKAGYRRCCSGTWREGSRQGRRQAPQKPTACAREWERGNRIGSLQR